MKELTFFEYSGYQDSTGNEADSLASTMMNLDEIQYLRSVSENLIPGKSIFEISSTKIRATSMVGVISFGGVQIEILPKLLKNNYSQQKESNSSILKNLMFILSFTNVLEINDVGIASLSQNCDSFIEAYISIFAQRLSRHLIRFGTPKAYVEKSENLNTMRGKISFAKHSSLNTFDQSHIFCDYAEFTDDNSLSKALKFVAQVLCHLTSNPSNLSSLNRCVGLLDGVQASFVTSEELDRLTTGRREPNFVALVNLTKMFLKHLRPEFAGHKKNKVFAILFDMNELFEEFIYQVLKKNESSLSIQVTAQKRKRLVSEEKDFLNGEKWVRRNLFDTYTDILVKPQNGPELIIDTKYKIVHSQKSHYGISNQDAYQVLAYRQIHKTEVSEPSVALLYPKSSEDIKKEFRINGSSSTFMAWTIDISRDLKSDMPSLVEELKKLIQKSETNTAEDVLR